MINIATRATYYTFCFRNRNWDSPDLHVMQFWTFFFWLLFCFVMFCFFVFVFLFFNPFFFLIIQSQAAFVNCLYVARFTIVHSKRKIKSLLLLPLLSLLFQTMVLHNLINKPLKFILCSFCFYHFRHQAMASTPLLRRATQQTVAEEPAMTRPYMSIKCLLLNTWMGDLWNCKSGLLRWRD